MEATVQWRRHDEVARCARSRHDDSGGVLSCALSDEEWSVRIVGRRTKAVSRPLTTRALSWHTGAKRTLAERQRGAASAVEAMMRVKMKAEGAVFRPG